MVSAGYRDHPLVFAGGGRILVTGDWISLVTGVQRETHIHTVSTDIIMRVSTRHDTTVVMVGDTKVGKSALVNKFRTGKFGSGFSAYVPARPLGSSSEPTKLTNNYDSSPDSPPRSFSSAYSKPSYSYSSSPSKANRDFQSPPKISGTLTRPTALSLMTAPDYNPAKVTLLNIPLVHKSTSRERILVRAWQDKEVCALLQLEETGKSSSLPSPANQVALVETEIT